MSGQAEDELLAGALGFACGFAICMLLACYIGDRRTELWKADAIEHGAAEYVIADPASGAVEFRWKEQK